MATQVSIDDRASPATSASPLASGADPYRAIHASSKRLSENASDQQALLELIQGYVRLGLRGPARELLCLIPASSRGELAAAISGPSGRAVWGARNELFEWNLAAMQARGILIQPIRESWKEALRSFELYVDINDVPQVRFQIPDGGWQWAPSLAHHIAAAAAAPAPRDHQTQLPGPYLFDGIGQGWHLHHVWRGSRRTFLGYSAAVYVVEPNTAALAAMLHLNDWRDMLADESVFFFIGPEAVAHFEGTLNSDDNLPIPTVLFREPLVANRPQGRAAQVDAAVQRAIDARDQAYDATVQNWSRSADRQTSAYWHDRIQSAWVRRERPLRVLAAVSTHTTFLQHSMRDALCALEQLGCQTRLLSDPRPYEKISIAAHHQAVREFDPDLLLSIDHLRSQSFERIPRAMPQITWDQDNLPNAFSDAAVRAMGPHDVVVGLAHIEAVARGCAAPTRFLASQMPTSERRFSPTRVDRTRIDQFRCDISFVSHASQTPMDFHTEERARMPDDPGRTLLDRIFALCIGRPCQAGSVDGGETRSILRQAEQETRVRVADPAMRERLESWYIWRLCDRIFRHQALEWAADWARRSGRSLRIYGRGWDRHPTLASFSAGNVANDEDLIQVYAGSVLNLQLMPAGFLHQRALDGLACGGFFLSRRTRADVRDARLPRVWREIGNFGYQSADELLAGGQSGLVSRFLEIGESLGYGRSRAACTFEFLRFDRQWDYAEEVFADYPAIAFESASGFEAAAERFLNNVPERRAIADRMRAAVIQRYSYGAKMRQFVQFLADFLSRLS